MQHGATLAMHLARRQVTHVIVGRSPAAAGGGGRLAAGKRERDMRRRIGGGGGCGAKYVGVEW